MGGKEMSDYGEIFSAAFKAMFIFALAIGLIFGTCAGCVSFYLYSSYSIEVKKSEDAK
jgi:MFS superfamily sulfate permease-like transporter